MESCDFRKQLKTFFFLFCKGSRVFLFVMSKPRTAKDIITGITEHLLRASIIIRIIIGITDDNKHNGKNKILIPIPLLKEIGIGINCPFTGAGL